MRFETIVNEKRPKLPRRRIAKKGGIHHLAEGKLPEFPALLAAQENATSQPLHIRRRLGNLMHDGVIWLTDARADLPTRTIYSRRLESP